MNYDEELQEKLEQEIKNLEQELLQLEPKIILDRAYEYVSKVHIKDEILGRNYLDNEEINAIMKTDNVLQSCYDSWQDEDSSLCEMYETSIDEALEDIVKEYKENRQKFKER